MSWAAHELENYVIVKHTGQRASFLFVALGALAPDLLTKGFVYGYFPVHVSDPARFHRGWPGAGFTHSILFGVLVAALILRFTRERGWALGFLIGHLAHSLTDINDSAGTMLMFPFSTVPVSTGMWRYGAEAGPYGDAAAYYSSLAGVWDLLWVGIVLVFARVTLTRQFFAEVVEAGDPRPWSWLRRRLGLNDGGLLWIYRAWFFYGAARCTGWFLYARLRTDQPLDLRWGGPYNIGAVRLYDGSLGRALASLTVGTLGVAATLVVAWRTTLRRWWAAATGTGATSLVGSVQPARDG